MEYHVPKTHIHAPKKGSVIHISPIPWYPHTRAKRPLVNELPIKETSFAKLMKIFKSLFVTIFMIIRPTEEKDLDVIVKLNNLSSKWVGYKEKDFFKKYLDLPFFLVAISNSKITGFILAMDQLTEYDCKYFLWFKKRFTHFLYIDRIVVDPTATKKSIGTKLYDRIISNRGDNPVLCEVAIDPRNDVSIKFHEKYGFKKVGTCCFDCLKTNNMLKLG